MYVYVYVLCMYVYMYVLCMYVYMYVLRVCVYVLHVLHVQIMLDMFDSTRIYM
jgi:hypothetical protein